MERKQDYINKMKKDKILEDLDENISYKKNQIIFYKKLEKMFEDLHLDNNKLIDMLLGIDNFFFSFYIVDEYKEDIISSYLNNAIYADYKRIKIWEIFTKLYPNKKNTNIEELQEYGLNILGELLRKYRRKKFSEEDCLFILTNYFDTCLDKALVVKKGKNSVLDLIVGKILFCFEKVKFQIENSDMDNNIYTESIKLIDTLIVKMKEWDRQLE